MLKNGPVAPTFTNIPSSKCPGALRTVTKLDGLFGSKDKWPALLQELHDEDEELALQALGLAICFLEDALIVEKTLRPGTFTRYTPESKASLEYMVLDSQSLQHLEVVESADRKREGSLLDFVDHCVTKFGKRQLKRWLLAPLMNVERITERQDAVQDLIEYKFQVNAVRRRMKAMPDIERLQAKIFTYSIKHRIKAVYFEDVSLRKLTEFRVLLKALGSTSDYLKELVAVKSEFRGTRLRRLLTGDDQGGLMPNGYEQELAQFDKLIIWKRVMGTDKEIPEPQAGLDVAFDEANAKVNQIKFQLNDFLEEVRKDLKCRQIAFSHAKFRFELEVPSELVKGNRKPAHLEFTSARKGFERFHTPEIKAYVEELERAEDVLKDAMVPFLCAIFTRFHEKKDMWSRLVSVLSEVDCLMSLAVASGE
jgi:DNA mismatch repair protein MSH6